MKYENIIEGAGGRLRPPTSNVVYRKEEREINRLCQDQGIGLIPWRPLARGITTGSRSRDGGKSHRSNNAAFGDRLYGRSSDYAVGNAVAAVAAPIVGTTKLHHLEDAVGAVDVILTDDEIAQLEAPYAAHPILGHG